jgi:hypothetical protein
VTLKLYLRVIVKLRKIQSSRISLEAVSLQSFDNHAYLI